MKIDTKKRYWLFAGDDYYPGGGLDDFVGSFDRIIDTLARLSEDRFDWYHILDTHTGDIFDQSHFNAICRGDTSVIVNGKTVE
jgi:alkanesulfonate monooxygenase SsuD/methylene tetrahydromethanopterin reductase-like flavin-dependent oxidoreductase (luciferase family)